jgi:NTP pyrophosphatase (non-canonical NTP hydrolase)
MAKGFANDKDELNDVEFPETIGVTEQLNPKEGTPDEVATDQIDFDRYIEFVDYVTSDSSKSYGLFTQRLDELTNSGLNVNRILTGAVGLSAESGEFMEIVKKMIFQGKPFNADNREHMITELGDVMWYVAQVCIALNISIDEVVQKNVAKLLKRYPEGVFDVLKSEVRASNDR